MCPIRAEDFLALAGGDACSRGRNTGQTGQPQGEQAGPVSLLWCHSLGRKA